DYILSPCRAQSDAHHRRPAGVVDIGISQRAPSTTPLSLLPKGVLCAMIMTWTRKNSEKQEVGWKRFWSLSYP
ncbi:MAG: hypothetical protein K6U03_10905, partial [Firmicutes bacterium]|nr:hypothetical protein [Bacillota bacterium]